MAEDWPPTSGRRLSASDCNCQPMAAYYCPPTAARLLLSRGYCYWPSTENACLAVTACCWLPASAAKH